MPEDEPSSSPSASDSKASRLWFWGLVALVLLGVVAALVFRFGPGPTPEEIAADPLLAEGFRLYQVRCAGCHGASGQGNSPVGPALDGFRHGDQPEQVLEVIEKGVQGTTMQGWGHVLDEAQLRALATYVYYLADRPVPEALRTGAGEEGL